MIFNNPMTQTELNTMNEIVSAYAEGKTIEYRNKMTTFSKNHGWKVLKEPKFDFVENEYRLFTEPEYMKIGRDELEMLRADYDKLINLPPEQREVAKIEYDIHQIGNIMRSISDLRLFIYKQFFYSRKENDDED